MYTYGSPAVPAPVNFASSVVPLAPAVPFFSEPLSSFLCPDVLVLYLRGSGPMLS